MEEILEWLQVGHKVISDLLSLFLQPEWIRAGAMVVLAYAALRALSTWRVEFLGKERVRSKKRAYAVLTRLRDRFHLTRSTTATGMPQEEEYRWRLDKLWETVQEVHEVQIDLSILWEDEVSVQLIETILKKFDELEANAGIHFMLKKQPPAMFNKQQKETYDIAYGTATDSFGQEVGELFEKVLRRIKSANI